MGNKNVKKIAAIVIVLVVVGAIAWLFISSRLVWTNPNGLSSTAKAVCSNDIVDTYNKAMYYEVRAGSTTPTLDADGLKKLQTEIKDKSGYTDDATCQTILFWTAINDKNYANAKSAYDAVKSLHGKGLFADSNLRSDQPLFMYESAVEALAPGAADVKKSRGDAN